MFEFKPIPKEEIRKNLLRGLEFLNRESGQEKTISEEALDVISSFCGGDARSSLNSLEICYYISDSEITEETALQSAQKTYLSYDRAGDDKFELLSALQKSIRGSDENAAVFYLARLLDAGDLAGACRRMLVIAAEDIGLAHPQAITVVKACVDSALMLGMPEAKIPLAEAAVFLATLPKSNTAYLAIGAAMEDIAQGKGKDMPSYLKNNHYFGVGETKGKYLYPHDFPYDWVRQQYLPDDLKDRVYYRFGENKTEQAAKAYWEKIKK